MGEQDNKKLKQKRHMQSKITDKSITVLTEYLDNQHRMQDRSHKAPLFWRDAGRDGENGEGVYINILAFMILNNRKT